MDLSSNENKKRLVPIRSLAQTTGYSAGHISHLCRTGKIVGEYAHNSWLVDADSFQKFLDTQAELKEARARELARSRAEEYRAHNKPLGRSVSELTKKLGVVEEVVSFVPELGLVRSSFRSHAFALSLAIAVVVSGATLAHGERLARLGTRVADVATVVAQNMRETYGDVPTHVTSRIADASKAMRESGARVAIANATVTGDIASPMFANPDLTRVQMVLGENNRTHIAQALALGSEASKLVATEPVVPMMTHEGVQALAVGAFELATSPSQTVAMLVRSYMALGTNGYAFINSSLATYRSLIEQSGARVLASAATTRDTLAHAPRLVSQMNLAIGHAVVGAAHGAIRAEVGLAYGTAAAAPATARTAVAFVGDAGDAIAQATAEVPALATAAFLRAVQVPVRVAPAIAQDIFNTEYAGADRFIAFTNAITHGYWDGINTTGALAYESAHGTRKVLDVSVSYLAQVPALIEDAYLGALGKSALALDTLAHTSPVAAALVATAPALSAGEQIALTTYREIHSLFDGVTNALAVFFRPSPLAIAPAPVNTQATLNSNTQGQTLNTKAPVRINQTVNTYPTYTTLVKGITQDTLDQSLTTERTAILATVSSMIRPVAAQTVTNTNTIQYVNMIQDLTNLIVRNGSFKGGNFDSGTLTNGVSVAANTATFGSLTTTSSTFTSLTAGASSLATTTITGTLTLVGDQTTSGSLTTGTTTVSGMLSASDVISAPYFVATSTTATSTFAGGLAVGTTTPYGNGLFTVGTTTPLLHISSNTGNVGVGALASAYRLDVNGTLRTVGDAFFNSNVSLGDATTTDITYVNSRIAGHLVPTIDNVSDIGDGTNWLRWRTGYFGTGVSIAGTASSTGTSLLASGAYLIDSASPLSFNTTHNQNVLFGTGNIGMGVSVPTYTLDVAGNAHFTSYVDASHFIATSTTATSTFMGGFVAGNNAAFVVNQASPANSLYVTSSGNIGMNTLAPAYKLDVNGTFRSVGDAFMNGNATVGGTLGVTGLTTLTNASTTNFSVASNLWIGGNATTTANGNFSTNGNGYFAGGLGVGVATTTPGVLETSGDAKIGGNLTVVGNSTTLGGSFADSITINSSVKSHLVPNQNITYDLGSPSYYWRNVYVGNIVANNISAASTTIAGTASATFTINSDNTSTDTEDATLVFFRGLVTPNALLSWNSAENAKRFEFNQSLYIQNASASTTLTTLDLKGVAAQTSDYFRIANSAGTNLLNFSAAGNLQTTGDAAFGGNATVGGTFTVNGLCVAADTRLRRRRKAKKGEESEADEEGYIYDEVMIKDIEEGDEIQSLDEKTGKLVWSCVKQLAFMGVKDIFKITTAGGKTIRTTGNHPYYVRKYQGKKSDDDFDNGTKVIIDYANMKAWARSQDLFIDMEKLQQVLTVSGFGFAHVYYGTDENNDKSAGFIRFLSRTGFIVITKNLQRFKIKLGMLLESRIKSSISKPLLAAVQKCLKINAAYDVDITTPKANFDVEITMLIMTMLNEKRLKKLVLFSGDGDFSALIKYARECGVDISVLSGRKFLSGGLIEWANRYTVLERFAQVTDGVFYRRDDIKTTRPRRGVENCTCSIRDRSAVSSMFGLAVDKERLTMPDEGSWKKVTALREGTMIAVVPVSKGDEKRATWDTIVKIERLPAEDVYDIEVEGTHNFIGNGIVAHNTAFFHQASSTDLSVTNKAYFGGTATSTFDSAGALTLASALAITSGGTGQTSFASDQLHYGNFSTVATSSLALGTGLNLTSGSLGYQVGGTNVTIKLADTAVTPASYGSSTAIPTFTVDQQGRLTAAGTAAVIAPAGTLTGTTLASNVVTSSLTTVGALASGSIASGFGTIATANTITGTTVNGTTGINTGATSGTQRIDASGNLVNIGTISSGAITSGLINGQTISSAANFTGSLTMNGAFANTSASNSYFTGNVGIGTTTPTTNLSVQGNQYTSGTAFFGGAMTATSTLTLSALGTPAGSLLAVNASGQLIATSTISVANLALAKGNFLVGNDAGVAQATSTIFISSTGSVGIGTTNPGYKLDVNGIGQFNAGIYDINSTSYSTGLRISNGADFAADKHVFSAYYDAITPTQFVLGSYKTTGGVRLPLNLNDGGVVTIAGNVGIGTTSPLAKLHVVKGASGQSTPNPQSSFVFENSSGNVMNMLAPNNSYSAIYFGDVSSNTLGGIVATNSTYSGAFATNALTFQAGNSPALTMLNTNGNVGIGTTSPVAKLQIFQTPAVGGPLSLAFGAVGNTGFYERASVGTLAYSSVGTDVWNMDVNEWIGLRGTGTQSAPRIRFAAGDVNIPTYAFQFDQDTGMWNPGTNLLELTTAGVSRLRIDSSGNVGIGTTTPAALLAVQGTSYISGNSFFGGAMTATSTLTMSALGTPAGSLLAVNASGQLIATSTISVANLALAKGNFLVGNDVGVAQATSTIFISSTGSVGIGTTIPGGWKLSVSGDTNISGNTEITGYLRLYGNPLYLGGSINVRNKADNGWLAAITRNTSGSETVLDMPIVGSLYASGNVGIGTTTPSNKLVISGDANTERINIVSSSDPVITLFHQNGTVASPTAVTSGNALGYYQMGGYDGTNNLRGAWMYGVATQDWTTSNRGTAIGFSTTPNDSTTIAERMRIDQSGNVGIGTTTPASKLDVASGNNSGLFVENNTGNNQAILISPDSTTGAFIAGGTYPSGNSSQNDSAGRIIMQGAVNAGMQFQYSNQTPLGTARTWTTGLVLGTDAYAGNVGIGTTGPGAKLDVQSSTGTLLNLLGTQAAGDSASATTYVAGNRYGTSFNILGFGNTHASRPSTLQIGAYNAEQNIAIMTDDSAAIAAGTSVKGIFIKTGGNVGIGTSSPVTKLDIAGNARATGGFYASGLDNTGVTGHQIRMAITGGVGYLQSYDFTAATYQPMEIGSATTTINSANTTIFGTGASFTERMRIDATGNVGIGVTNPQVVFSGLTNNGSTQRFGARTRTNGEAIGGVLAGQVADFGGFYGAATAPSASISFGAQGSTGGQGAIGFLTSPTDTLSTEPTMRMVITNGGNVGIGTTTPAGLLHVYSSTYSSGLNVGDNTTLTTEAKGWRVLPYSDGNLYIDHKVVSSGSINYRFGAGAGSGGVYTFLKVDGATNNLLLNPTLGNVGIGTASPSQGLQVVSTDADGSFGTFASTAGQGLSINPNNTAGTVNVYSDYLGGSEPKLHLSGYAQRASTGGITIDNSSNVGIGTTAPGTKLSVYESTGGTSVYMSIGAASYGTSAYGVDSNGARLSAPTGKAIQFITDAGTSMFINNLGNVGIGTTGPGELLTVAKNQNAATTVFIDNNLYNAGNTATAAVLKLRAGLSGSVANLYTTLSQKADGTFRIAGETSGDVITISGGNVGIGTTAPAGKLGIETGTNGWPDTSGAVTGGAIALRMRGSNNGILDFGVNGGAGSWIQARDQVTYANNYVLALNPNGGNVGIGTTNPLQKLHVVSGTSGENYPLELEVNGSGQTSQSTGLRFRVEGNANDIWAKGGIAYQSTGTFGRGSMLFLQNNTADNSNAAVANAVMAITAAGNVGIGTTGPGSSLEIYKSVLHDVGPILTLNNPAGGAANAGTSAIDFKGFSGATQPTMARIQINDDGSYGSMMTFQTKIQGTAGALTERMRIDNTGNVGIGTTGPGYKLDVLATSGNGTQARFGNNTFFSEFNSESHVTSGADLTSGGTWTARTASAVDFNINASAGGSIQFNRKTGLTPGNAFTWDTSMTILSDGNVGVGTTSPATKLEVGGNTANVTFDGYLNCAGFTSDANGKLACTASDERLKQDIISLKGSGALAGLDALNPVSFFWRDASMGTQQQFGLIAQQVEAVFPNLVQRTNPTPLTPGGTLTVNYSGFISPMILAIQELNAKVKLLEPLTGVLSIEPGVESQCVVGDTRLRRRRKREGPDADIDEFEEIEIKDIVAGDEIQSLDERTGRAVYSRVNALIDMGEQEVFELVTKSGRRIRTTSNHPFLARERATKS